MLRSPEQALMKLLAITLILFIFGLLPWVDNFAHLFGFAFGFLLSYALLPFLSFGPYDRHKKIFLIWVCLLSCLSLFILLVLLFYFIPVYDCELCSYLNCLPLTRDFCASQNINLKQEDHLVWHMCSLRSIRAVSLQSKCFLSAWRVLKSWPLIGLSFIVLWLRVQFSCLDVSCYHYLFLLEAWNLTSEKPKLIQICALFERILEKFM